MLVHRLRLAVTLSCGLLLLTIFVGTSLLLNRLEDSARRTGMQTVERVARVAESTVNRHFLAVDGMLAGLTPLIGQLGRDGKVEPGAANRMLRELNFQNLNFRDLMLLQPDGRPWATALAGSRNRPPPIDPERLAEARGSGAAVISGPIRSTNTGEWTLFFLRALELPGGPTLVAAAEVPTSLVTTMLSPVGELPGLRIAVERVNAQLLASLPHDETRIGRTLRPLDASLPQDGSATEIGGRFTDERVLAAVRPTLYRDIQVVASLEATAAYAGYEQDRQRLHLIAFGSILLIGALGLALHLALRQRERIEAERAAARGLLESAIESLPDGFVMFDADDRLVICNQRYRDLYAVSAPFIVPNARFEDIIREGARRGQYPQAGDDIEAFVADTKAWHRGNHPSMERLLPDGRWVLVTERSTPGGGTVGIRTDITALKHAMADLALARDTAAAATEAKSRFLARMSHELRTPLNGVLGLAQVLARDPALSGEQRARAETLESAGRHLVSVANDVLDLAKVEAGRLELRLTAAELPDLLGDCATLVRQAAVEKHVTIALDLAPSLPPLVETDQTRLRQLVLNLLSNAVKFTPPGGRVELAAWPLGAAGEDGLVPLRIEVRDTGPGVPEAERRAIFGDFVQLDHGRAGGTGLGLAIAAGIAGQMGGSIGCEAHAASPTGTGAVFWVELRLRPLRARAVAREAPAGLPRRRLHVLVADDVPANLAVARALLESAGHTTQCVSDGAMAVETLRAPPAGPPIDLVLMDVMMPGMDGLEATRRIRALPGPASRVPILAVTASAFSEDIAACREAGMDAHLAKPIEREALVAMLARLTGEAPPPPADAAPAPRLGETPLLQRRGATSLAVPGLDPEAERSLFVEFLRELRAATEALRQAELVMPERLVPAVHRLAGAAATLGAARLALAARHLQSEATRISTEEAHRQREAVLAVAVETIAALETAAADDGAAPVAAAH